MTCLMIQSHKSLTGNKGLFVLLTKLSCNLPLMSSLQLNFQSPQILSKFNICGRLKCDIPVNGGFVSSAKCKFAQNSWQSQIQSQT